MTFLKETFSKRRIKVSLEFSLIAGVTYWATSIYEKGFETNNMWVILSAFFLVAFVLLIFGGTFLDLITDQKNHS